MDTRQGVRPRTRDQEQQIVVSDRYTWSAVKLTVLSPYGLASGGPEALHQLVSAARKRGWDASICYYPDGNPEVMPQYEHYDVAVVSRIADSADTVVVAPETAVHLLLPLRRARKALWWLSVDNFFVSIGSPVTPPAADPALLQLVRSQDPAVIHLTQSHYARQFLRARGVSSMMLSDYLSDAFVDGAAKRQSMAKRDVVLFNPKKGAEFTNRLIEASGSQFDFVPIQNLTPAGVADLLSSAKLYIDFGEHPGRDRLPREAAVSGCCVLTGRRGAAGNDIDLPIPRRFALDEACPTVLEQFNRLASEVLSDFDRVSAEFDDYRNWVLGHREDFTRETVAFLVSASRPRLQGFETSKSGTRTKRKAKGRRR
jgi:hypothetical protein